MANTTSAATNQGPTPEMLLIFRLSGEAFAISVNQVHEILDPLPVTPVPNSSDFAPALVNVRGAIVPLINVRQRLQMPQVKAGNNARLIVLELMVGGAPTRLAIMTDSVEEVMETDVSALEMIPNLGANWPEQFIKGVARRSDGLAILLDTENLFRPDLDRAEAI